MNIMMVGVGGQGLVLTSGIIAEVARRSGYDVKTNDVIGLSQRGGRVWASIRFDDKVYSMNIPDGEADVLIALEPLEGLRYKNMLKKDGIILMNERIIYPADVVFEKTDYPMEDIEQMLNKYQSFSVDATSIATTFGNKMVANTILLGMLAGLSQLDRSIWEDVITEFVPSKAKLMNQEAFDYGYRYVDE